MVLEDSSFRRSTEFLRPIDTRGAFRIVEIGDPHLREPRPHDVLAMMRALEPTLDDCLCSRDAARDVLTCHAPLVPGTRHAVAGGASVTSGVLEPVVRCH